MKAQASHICDTVTEHVGYMHFTVKAVLFAPLQDLQTPVFGSAGLFVWYSQKMACSRPSCNHSPVLLANASLLSFKPVVTFKRWWIEGLAISVLYRLGLHILTNRRMSEYCLNSGHPSSVSGCFRSRWSSVGPAKSLTFSSSPGLLRPRVTMERTCSGHVDTRWNVVGVFWRCEGCLTQQTMYCW